MSKNELKFLDMLSKKLGGIGKRDEKKLLNGTYGSYPYEDLYNRTYAIVNVQYHGWQVLRYVRISRKSKRNPSYTFWEVMQVWSKLGEGQVIIARKRGMSRYADAYHLDSKLELRRPAMYNGSGIDIPYMYIYHKSVGDVYKKIDSLVDSIERRRIFFTRRKMYQLISESHFPEHFIKTNPYLCAYVDNYVSEKDKANYVTAFKIIARHHYEVEHPTDYLMYLDALIFLGKDLHNPYYVCPVDFKGMLEKYTSKQLRILNERKKAEIAKRQAKDNERYQEWRKRFFGMEITDGTISCKILRGVYDFYEEGKAMHNCVYENQYYAKPYSLIMSARIDGKRVETVEFDLKERKVVQAYGFGNKFSDHHKEIVELVNANASLIESYDKSKLMKQAV